MEGYGVVHCVRTVCIEHHHSGLSLMPDVMLSDCGRGCEPNTWTLHATGMIAIGYIEGRPRAVIKPHFFVDITGGHGVSSGGHAPNAAQLLIDETAELLFHLFVAESAGGVHVGD